MNTIGNRKYIALLFNTLQEYVGLHRMDTTGITPLAQAIHLAAPRTMPGEEIGRGLYSRAQESYSESPMWNVEERFSPKAIDSLAALGFSVGSTRGVVRAEKYGCGAEFRVNPDGRYQLTILPAIMFRGQFTRLWDAGYQKFLLRSDGKKLPALASQLTSLRRFNEDLRSVLGLTTHYNEGLGSVCELTAYDRVKGRPGDVPDESVGAKAGAKH